MMPIEEEGEQLGYLEQGYVEEDEEDDEEAIMQKGSEAEEDVVN
jgi:hypothetical protein